MRHTVHALAFGPHPDDVEIFCGGVMIRLAQLGYRTGVIDLTRGELASRGTVEERAREAAAAAEVLGLAFRENLGLPDGFLDGSSDPHVRAVVESIRGHRPEILLVPWLEERHPDHVAAAQLLTRAAFLAGLSRFQSAPAQEPFAPRRVVYYEMRHRMPASFVVDTTEAWPRKLEAMRCHGSQVGSAGAPTLIGSPHALAAIEARDRYHGSRIGVPYGEPLRTMEALGVADPIALLRLSPSGDAHLFEPSW
ncbi:MAG TPA: bacillithiol biosynthesis deacetylase BshB1 [Candidatus Polarisedimenticolaceae bacterium]|nr:bacillithiol biosynthesis deacetylase BshB1 [Candidatus Polarisedimenticolaceae bacterium]